MPIDLNRLSTAIFVTKLIKLPEITQTDLSIYQKYTSTLDDLTEKKFHFKKREIANITSNLEFKKNIRFHKIFSVVLLTTSAAMVATAAVLATVVNPLFGLLAFGTLIPSFISVANFTRDIRNSYNDAFAYMSFIPLLIPSLYVYEAFTHELKTEENLTKKLNENISRYKRIEKKEIALNWKISKKIRTLSRRITDVDCRVNFDRLKNLRHALEQLDANKSFLADYKGYCK